MKASAKAKQTDKKSSFKNAQWPQTLGFMNACYAVVLIIECFTLSPTLRTDVDNRRLPGFKLISAINDANRLDKQGRKTGKKYKTLMQPLLKGIELDAVMKSFLGARSYQEEGIDLLSVTMMINIVRLLKYPPKTICFEAGQLTKIGPSDNNYFMVDNEQITAVDKLKLVSCNGFVELFHESSLYFVKRNERLPKDEAQMIANADEKHAFLRNSLEIEFDSDEAEEVSTPKKTTKSAAAKESSPAKRSKNARKSLMRPAMPWSPEALKALKPVGWTDEESLKKDVLAVDINGAMKQFFKDDKEREQVFKKLQMIKEKHIDTKLSNEDWHLLFSEKGTREKLHAFQNQLKLIPAMQLERLAKWQKRDKLWMRIMIDPDQRVPIENQM